MVVLALYKSQDGNPMPYIRSGTGIWSNIGPDLHCSQDKDQVGNPKPHIMPRAYVNNPRYKAQDANPSLILVPRWKSCERYKAQDKRTARCKVLNRHPARYEAKDGTPAPHTMHRACVLCPI